MQGPLAAEWPEDYRDVLGNLEIDPSKIIFRKGTIKSSIIYNSDVSKLRTTSFDASLESIFVIHGWTSNNNASGVIQPIRGALITKHNFNIINVDWSKYSSLDYTSSSYKHYFLM